jgi:ligand-binding SRPBCC domain-containing protein
MLHFLKESRIEATPEELYDWHMQPDAFDKLVPPWQKVEVLERPERLEEGAVLVMKVYAGPIGVRWVARHGHFIEGRQFVDEQVKGPFASWRHTHQFLPSDDGASLLRDSIEYALPVGRVGELFGGWFSRRMLERMFDYRHAKTAADLS